MTIVYEDYNLKHQPCPFSSCGSSDAFSYEINKKVGFCHSCGGKYSYKSVGLQDWAEDKYPTNKESNYMNVTEFTPKRIEDLSEGKYEAMRGINASTMQDYNVLTYDDRQEYIYPSGGIKVRKLGEKAFYAKDGFKGDELFGMNLYPAGCSKIVTITEGELDALSVCQMTQNQYLNPSVSLPSATPSKRLWENCKEWLSSFEKIILSVDNDDAGNALADRMARLFPNKVYRVQHGEYKDANDFLQAGREREFKNLWWKPLKHTPENILNTSDQFLKLYDETPEHVYYKTGIEALDDKILGLMQGHFTVFKAPTGIGKTELMRYMEYSMLQQNIPIAAWHLEETKLRSLLGLVSYEVGDNLTRRDLIEEKKADGLVREAIGNITKDENFYQFYLGDGQGADELIDQIRFFSQACDCKFVFFEPIQDVVVGTSEDSKESMLADLSIRLSKLAAELNVGIVTIAHTNENGDPKYCKMIGQRASVIIDLHRDKEADNMEERNTTYLKVEKNRPCSEEGQAGRLSFDLDTFMLTEIQ
jgi:twinkle protein